MELLKSIDPIYIGTYQGKLRIGLLEVNRGLMCLVCNKGSARSIRNKKVVNLYSAEMDKNTFKRKVILGMRDNVLHRKNRYRQEKSKNI